MERSIVRAAAVFSVVLIVSKCAFAGGAGVMPYEGWLKVFQESVTGPVAAALILIGLVGTGAMLVWGGEVNTFLKSMVYLTLVACFIVGAMKLYQNYFQGDTGYSLQGSDRPAVSVLDAGAE